MKKSKGKYVVVGGESLGEGTYGCVISSALADARGVGKCANFKKQNFKVAKVFVEFDRAMEEYNEAENLQHIKDIDKYTILPKGICSFALSELSVQDKNQLLADCERIRDATLEDYYQFGQLFYSDRGVTLSSYWRKQSNVDMNVLINHFVNLSKGINAFVNNRFIHYDIKPTNIIVTDTDSTAKFIDFGLSRSFEDFVSKLGPELAKYPYWPPELYYNIPYAGDYRYIRVDYDREDSTNAIKKLKKVFKPETQFLDEANVIDSLLLEAEKAVQELPTPKEKDQRFVSEFLRRPGAREPLFTKQGAISMLTNVYQPMLEKIDVFSLGVTLQNILDIVKQKESVRRDASKMNQLNRLQEIVQIATNPNPFERPHPKRLMGMLSMTGGSKKKKSGVKKKK